MRRGFKKRAERNLGERREKLRQEERRINILKRGIKAREKIILGQRIEKLR